MICVDPHRGHFLSRFRAVLHHNIGKICGESGVLTVRERVGTGHDHEGVARVFRTVERMNVRVRVGGKARAFIECLTAAGYFIHRLVDFEDNRLVLSREQFDCLCTQTLTSPFRDNAEIPDVEIFARVPIQDQAGKMLPAIKQAKMIRGWDGSRRCSCSGKLAA